MASHTLSIPGILELALWQHQSHLSGPSSNFSFPWLLKQGMKGTFEDKIIFFNLKIFKHTRSRKQYNKLPYTLYPDSISTKILLYLLQLSPHHFLSLNYSYLFLMSQLIFYYIDCVMDTMETQ